MVLLALEKTCADSEDITSAFSVTLLLPLFPLTSPSIVGHALNALSSNGNLPGSNGYASGAVPDFVYLGTFNTSGGIVYIAKTLLSVNSIVRL